jgi:cytoskeletal protein RodZ
MTVPEPSDQYHANSRVGATLRELRISRGIALEEVARVTRIGKGYLLAIEEDRLDKLPSGAYSRGFIRQYAQFLGLGEAEIADLLAPPLPKSGDNDRSGQERGPLRRQPKGANAKKTWLLPALLLVLIVLIALVTGDRRPGPVVQPTATVEHPIPAVAPAVTQPRQLAVTSARRQQEQPVGGQQPGGDSPGEGVVLRLKVVQDSWLTITIDDAMSQQYELKSGDVIEWKGERSFMLDVGNGAAFEGDFNGKPIQSLGEAGKPAHLVLRANTQNAP